MALARHLAADSDKRRRAEVVLLRAQDRGDDQVPGRLEAAVRPEQHAAPQIVEDEDLLGLGEAKLPGAPGVLDRAERRGAGAAGVAADQDVVGVALGDAGGDGAHAGLGDELHGDPGARIHHLEVVDKLREVFDAIDVVMRGRRDQRRTRLRMPQPCDVLHDLVAGKLAAFAGLRPLRHLDLDLVAGSQILRGHAEAARGYLLDAAVGRGAALGGPIARRFVAAFPRVALATDHVERRRKGDVGLRAQRAERHRRAVEALHDGFGRLDLFQGNGGAARLELEQVPDIHGRVVLHEVREDLVVFVAVRLDRGVERADHPRTVGMALTVVAEPVVPHVVELVEFGWGEASLVFGDHVLAQVLQREPADPRRGPGEALLDKRLREADGLEYLRAVVAGDGADTHLGHDLEDAAVERLAVARLGLVQAHVVDVALLDKLGEGLEPKVGLIALAP